MTTEQGHSVPRRDLCFKPWPEHLQPGRAGSLSLLCNYPLYRDFSAGFKCVYPLPLALHRVRFLLGF